MLLLLLFLLLSVGVEAMNRCKTEGVWVEKQTIRTLVPIQTHLLGGCQQEILLAKMENREQRLLQQVF